MEIEDGVASFPNGLRLRLTPELVAPMAIYNATERHPDPLVPLYSNPDTGLREPNPDDPDYKCGLELAKQRRSWAATRAMIIMGTALEAAPEGLPLPDDIDWERLAAVRDVPAPSNPLDRYEMWLRYHALTHRTKAADGLAEFAALVTWLAGAAGITMEGVAGVVASFRDAPGRGTDHTGDVVAPVRVGDGD